MELSTERLLLREFKHSDLSTYVSLRSHPSYSAGIYPEEQLTPAFTEQLLQRFILWQQQTPRERFQLCLGLREKPQHCIGSVGIRIEDANQGIASLGYELAVEYRHLGLAQEAARAMIGLAWQQLKVGKLQASVYSNNRASMSTLQALGFEQSHKEQQHTWFELLP